MALPRGIRNNNPLNIKKGNNWHGEQSPQSDPAFEQFLTMAHGLRAGFIILKNYMKKTPKADTIETIIRRWAPESDNNNVEAYINTVSQRSGIPRYQRLAFADSTRMCALVEAMAYVECGRPIDTRVIATAYEMAR